MIGLCSVYGHCMEVEDTLLLKPRGWFNFPLYCDYVQHLLYRGKRVPSGRPIRDHRLRTTMGVPRALT